MKHVLNPTLDDLKLKCVLVQAWKKASKYIRQHNWYADMLELDYQSLRLPDFLSEIQVILENAHVWEPTPLRVVPAPKSQKWKLKGDKWFPAESIDKKLRPLAHVSLVDQVVATSIMICMADHFETLQGDPILSIAKARNRKKIISYGNRLFCDNLGDILRHRWGSSKLYRQYFIDYQTFLRRPSVVADELKKNLPTEEEIAIVQSDLSKFYDRVRPSLLIEKIKKYSSEGTTESWFTFIGQVFNWGWHDSKWVEKYSKADKENPIEGFQKVALPQGLVASGFFANLVLLDLDRALVSCFGTKISDQSDIVIQDACRYVDDICLVLTIPKNTEEGDIQSAVTNWLQGLLDGHAKGLLIEESKTKVTVEGRNQQFLIPQSKTANRIQKDVSGTFDMLHGTELLGAIEGFFHTQQRYSQENRTKSERAGLLIGISDIRDDTAARFAAGKFRRVFRSLRPILYDGIEVGLKPIDDEEENNGESYSLPKLVLSKQQLDERGQLFAAMLIEEWVTNPSYVRLLRIALDIYPDHKFLEKILTILKDGWTVKGCKSHRKEVKQYCLAEIFRAGATETGMVADNDCLPQGVDLAQYHKSLTKEAKSVLTEFSSKGFSGNRFSWYLMQQVFLYLAARNETKDIKLPSRRGLSMLSLYQNFIGFLNGEHQYNVERRCTFSALAVSAFANEEILGMQKLSEKYFQRLSLIAPSVAGKFWEKVKNKAQRSHYDIARRIGLVKSMEGTLPEMASRLPNPFWREDNLLLLATEVADYLSENDLQSPWQITGQVADRTAGTKFDIPEVESIKIGKHSLIGSEMFVAPDWVEGDNEKKRYKLGMALRFALRGDIDFLRGRSLIKKSRSFRYSLPVSHWELLQYGGYHGRTAFAPEWIPISSWMEDLLFELLRWPGCGTSEEPLSFANIKQKIYDRQKKLEKLRGKASGLIFLEQSAPPPYRTVQNSWHRPIRIGVVQSVFPDSDVFREISNSSGLRDPTLSEPETRTRHRQHLVTMIEGIEQMLRVRETHIENSRSDGRLLDLLVFPELSVHPQDLNPILIPFVRRHRCIVLAGLVFHQEDMLSGAPLINSAMWLIPEWKKDQGLQIRRIQQGKWHLTSLERSLNPAPVPFRPAQWIVNYEWEKEKRPLRISASICYDSTDLSLASDLKSSSDIFVVCALNQDVGTFDRMAESLHYHMFQGVIIVNNGQFGGSNFYMPFGEIYHRQVLHLHGQPQAQIAFIEADPEKMICKGTNSISSLCIFDNIDEPRECLRCTNGSNECPLKPTGKWKTPPAGWNP